MPAFPLYRIRLGGDPEFVLLRNYQIGKNSTTPTQTINDLKQMFLSDTPDHRHLYIANNGGGGAHAIVPYALQHDSVNQQHYYISVYDNSYPNDLNAVIDVDVWSYGGNGSWTYSNWNGWGGPWYLYVMDPASTYLEPMVMPFAGKGRNHVSPFSAVKTDEDASRLEVYVSQTASVILTNSNGKRVGFDSSGVVNEIDGAFPMMPATGEMIHPVGYDLPGGSYSILLDRFTGPEVYCSIMNDSGFLRYSRTDAHPGQHDRLTVGAVASVINSDTGSKQIDLKVVMNGDNSEKTIGIRRAVLSGGDSIMIMTSGGGNLTVSHQGQATTFDLRLRNASRKGAFVFEHGGIPFDRNTGLSIRPAWSESGDSVIRILIDHGNTGMPNDSILLGNQTLGVREQPTGTLGQAPACYALHQNYPNPFNPVTIIRYEIPAESHICLLVFNTLGQEVAALVNDVRRPGQYQIQFDPSNLPAGLYFYRLDATSISDPSKHFSQTRKMILLK